MSDKVEKSDFRYEQESQADRLARKSKEMPIFPLGNYVEMLILEVPVCKSIMLKILLYKNYENIWLKLRVKVINIIYYLIFFINYGTYEYVLQFIFFCMVHFMNDFKNE